MSVNSPAAQEQAQRRCMSELLISANAVIGLGVWTVIKIIMEAITRREEILELIPKEGPGAGIVTAMIVIVFLAVIVLTIADHIYIGLAARAFALKKPHAPPCLILAAILLALTVVSAADSAIDLVTGNKQVAEHASLITDLTLIYALISLIRSYNGIKRIRKAHRAAQADSGR